MGVFLSKLFVHTVFLDHRMILLNHLIFLFWWFLTFVDSLFRSSDDLVMIIYCVCRWIVCFYASNWTIYFASFSFKHLLFLYFSYTYLVFLFCNETHLTINKVFFFKIFFLRLCLSKILFMLSSYMFCLFYYIFFHKINFFLMWIKIY